MFYVSNQADIFNMFVQSKCNGFRSKRQFCVNWIIYSLWLTIRNVLYCGFFYCIQMLLASNCCIDYYVFVNCSQNSRNQASAQYMIDFYTLFQHMRFYRNFVGPTQIEWFFQRSYCSIALGFTRTATNHGLATFQLLCNLTRDFSITNVVRQLIAICFVLKGGGP